MHSYLAADRPKLSQYHESLEYTVKKTQSS